ncbi:MAG: EamA family transporter, partial [Myxococcaceae bacterium]
MPWVATGLLVVSAFTHAIWNLLAKRSRAPLASLWWTLAGSALLCGAYLAARGQWQWPSPPALRLLLVGGVAEAVYLYALTRAYACGELSLAYPISRGSAPLLVALWAALLWGERLPWGGYLGLALL